VSLGTMKVSFLWIIFTVVTLTSGRCCGTPARLQEAVRCNWRGLIRQCVVSLHENGSFPIPNRGAASRRLRDCSPHSPHFAHNDFHPLRVPKKHVAGKRFAIATDAQQAVTSRLQTLDIFLLRRDRSLCATVGEILKCQW
jgi:hypothetical protein